MSRPEYYGNPAGLTQDIDVVRAIYAAFAVRDIEGALDFVSPNCEIHVETTARAAGTQGPYVGHQGLRDYFADVEAVWHELELHAEDYRVVPGSVVVMGHVEGHGDAGPLPARLHLDVAALRRPRRRTCASPTWVTRPRVRGMLRFVRYGLPAVLVVAGFVLLIAAPDSTRYEGFSMCVGAGLSLLLLNWLFRIGATGDRERDEEEAASDYLAEHGHWPDEKKPR